MVTGGDHRRSGAQQVDRDFRRDAFSAGGIFAVDDDEIERFRLLKNRKLLDHGLSAGFADDVAKKQNANGGHVEIQDGGQASRRALMFRHQRTNQFHS